MFIVVLNDGETFTELKGSKVCLVPDHLLDTDLTKADIDKLPWIPLDEKAVMEAMHEEGFRLTVDHEDPEAQERLIEGRGPDGTAAA